MYVVVLYLVPFVCSRCGLFSPCFPFPRNTCILGELGTGKHLLLDPNSLKHEISNKILGSEEMAASLNKYSSRTSGVCKHSCIDPCGQ